MPSTGISVFLFCS